MISFLRLNLISFLYSIIFICWVISFLNAYRFERLTTWTFDQTSSILLVFCLLITILLSIAIVQLSKNWFPNKLIIWWSTVLWTPYFIGIIALHNILFPITNRGDMPSAGTGFALLLALFSFIFYIVILLGCISVWPKVKEELT